MSEYMEYALGIRNSRGDLDESPSDHGLSVTKAAENEALFKFKQLILSRPDVGKTRLKHLFLLYCRNC